MNGLVAKGVSGDFMRNLKIIAGPLIIFLILSATSVLAETPYTAPRDLDRLSENASIDCTKVNNNTSSSTVARILCSGRDGAAADWDLNSGHLEK